MYLLIFVAKRRSYNDQNAFCCVHHTSPTFWHFRVSHSSQSAYATRLVYSQNALLSTSPSYTATTRSQMSYSSSLHTMIDLPISVYNYVNLPPHFPPLSTPCSQIQPTNDSPYVNHHNSRVKTQTTNDYCKGMQYSICSAALISHHNNDSLDGVHNRQ